jgi:hypothetical protein
MITCKNCGRELELNRFGSFVHYMSSVRLCNPDDFSDNRVAEAQVSR